MAIVQVQKAGAVSNAAAFGSNVTAGNLLVLVTGLSATCSGVTDTVGNTWTKVVEKDLGDGLMFSGIWYVKNCGGGSNTVTAANGFGASFGHVWVGEYSGIDTTAPLDQSTSANSPGVNGTAFSSGNVTTTTADELLIGGIANESAASVTWDTGWGEQYDDTTAAASRSLSTADWIVSSTGSYAASGNTSASMVNNPIVLATFKIGGAPPPPTTINILASLGAG